MGACSSGPLTGVGEMARSETSQSDAVRATGPVIDSAKIIAAVERLHETPHRAEAFLSLSGDSQATDGLDTNLPISRYEFDGTWSSSTVLLGPGQATGTPMGFTITDRNTAYFYMPGFADMPEALRASSADPMVDAYDAWISADFNQVRAAAPPDLPVTIRQAAQDELDKMIETLRTAPTAIEGPRSSSRGVETRTYEMLIEPGSDIDLFSSPSVFTIHLDAQERVREVASVNDLFGSSRVEYFDFEEEIVIEVPTDALDRTAKFVALFAGAPSALPTMVPPRPTPTPTVPFIGPTVLDRIDEQPELSIFRELIAEGQNVELMLDLPNPEPWTIFAPTNDALEALGPALDQLREEPLRARTFVLEHVVKGSYSLDELAELQSVISFAGWSIRINSDNGQFTVGSLRRMQPVLVGDMVAGDGVVHILAHTLDTSFG